MTQDPGKGRELEVRPAGKSPSKVPTLRDLQAPSTIPLSAHAGSIPQSFERTHLLNKTTISHTVPSHSYSDSLIKSTHNRGPPFPSLCSHTTVCTCASTPRTPPIICVRGLRAALTHPHSQQMLSTVTAAQPAMALPQDGDIAVVAARTSSKTGSSDNISRVIQQIIPKVCVAEELSLSPGRCRVSVMVVSVQRVGLYTT